MSLLSRVEKLEQEVVRPDCQTCAKAQTFVLFPGSEQKEPPTACPECGAIYETFTISPTPLE